MTKIIFFQPAYAHYRDQLFSILSERHNIRFIYGFLGNRYYQKSGPDQKIQFSFIDQHFKSRKFGILYYLLREKPEIVISSISTSNYSILTFIYTKIFRKKMILWMEEWRKPQYKKKNIKNILGIIQYKIAKKIILKSDALVVGGTVAYNYALSLGRKEGIFKVLQCSNDIKMQQNQNYPKVKSNRYTFLYLSRILPVKGLDLLIKAFGQLEKEQEDVFLLIAGEGPFKEYCINLSNSLKVKNIQFLGSINPTTRKEIFSRADIFVLPSYFYKNLYEGWGLVINEAMSMELPIITTTAVGSAFDLVENRKNGYIVQENNVNELYNAMKTIIDQDLKQMGQVSRKIFEEKNDFIKMADGFTDAINYVRKKG